MSGGPPALPDPLAMALVFLTSAAVLILEVVALRLVAPYVGITLETNSGIIGVALAAIATGAFAGGRLADRDDPRKLLGVLLIVGGALICLVPPVVRRAGDTLTGAEAGGVLLLAALAIFLPAAVLSAVPPMTVKLQLASLSDTGTVVGRLSGVSTLGAIAGTLLTGFVLVRHLSAGTILVVTGGLMLVFGVTLAVWLRGARRDVAVVAVVGGLVAAGATVVAGSPCDVETRYHCARVQAEGSSGQLLILDTLRHSYVDADDPTYLEFAYANAVASVIDVRFPPGAALDALHIGGGGLTFPRYLEATRPGGTDTVLEVDPGVAEIALGLSPRVAPSLDLEVTDGRVGLRRQDGAAFDVVVGDAFGGISVPWHLTTRETVRDVQRVLRPDGVYVLNVIDHPPGDFVRAELATVMTVFAHVAMIASPGALDGSTGGNYVLVASDSPLPMDGIAARVDERLEGRGIVLQTVSGPGLDALAEGGVLLTDDFAPVDQLLTPYGN